MRTASEFNLFYATPDPWRISRARFRDRALQWSISKVVSGKAVLELGCGEGHLTEAVFGTARKVKGIDISNVAIDRARRLNLSNAHFENADFLNTSFKGYDVVAAVECLYYLTPDDQESFFRKVTDEHHGLLVITGPIIGQNEHRKYFTHQAILDTFTRHHIAVVEFHNLSIHRNSLLATIAAALVRLPFFCGLLDWLPNSLVFQRCYILRV